MWVLPCGLVHPLHSHHLKHTVWDKEELLLISAVPPCDNIDMAAFQIWIEIDEVEDRGVVVISLCTAAECLLAIEPVSGCGQEHGHTVHLAHSEERLVLIWQAPTSIESIIKRPWNTTHSKITGHRKAVYTPHNGHNILRDYRVIHTYGLIEDGAKLTAAKMKAGGPHALACPRDLVQDLNNVLKCLHLELLMG